jgi:TolB-like protein
MTPDATAIRGQLEKMLASDIFATAGRHSRLLRYLVDRTLAGEGEQLKEYVLGTEVFDRADSYDPRLDSIVRVEVRRLRSRLEDYYRTVGATDQVVISIPRGSYIPVFDARAAGPPTAPSTAVRERRAYSPAVMIAAAASVAIVLLAAGGVFNNTRESAQASTGPGIAVLPFEHYSATAQDMLIVAQLTDAVTAELAKIDTVSVASRTSAARYGSGQESVIDIANALNVDFVMEASAVVTGNLVHVVARVVDGRLDRKVWVGEYDVPRADISASAARIAADTAAAVLRYPNPR